MLRGSKSKAEVSGRLHKGRRGEVDYWSYYVRLERTRETFRRKIWLINYQTNTGRLVNFVSGNEITFIKITIERPSKILNCSNTRTHNSKLSIQIEESIP